MAKITAEQLIAGLIDYADAEVIASLPTTGKWLLGAGIGLVSKRIKDAVYAMNENQIVKALGIIDSDGLYDVDLLIDSLRASASKYGKMTIQVPLVGKLTFSDADIENIKKYME